MRDVRIFITRSSEETVKLGQELAGKLMAGDLVALVGELGAGKTMFTKGIAKGLGITDHDHVNSPSYVVMKEYPGNKPLYHFDIYRLEEKSFCETLDHEKYFYGNGVTVVEWADKIADILPDEYLEVRITCGEADERKFEFIGHGDRFTETVNKLRK